jgi:hypothetical protein
VFDRLAPPAHGLGVFVEPPLHGSQRVIRRCSPVVPRRLIGQAWQAFVP